MHGLSRLFCEDSRHFCGVGMHCFLNCNLVIIFFHWIMHNFASILFSSKAYNIDSL